MMAEQAAQCSRATLTTAMGPAIEAALADPEVIEVMVNPDGSLRLDRLDTGRVDTDERFAPSEVERVIRLVANHAGVGAHESAAIISAELSLPGQGTGERFEGILPPVSTAPCFAVRKSAAKIYSLSDHVAGGIMSAEAARILSLAVVERRNVLVVGGTGSGKTTLANALLAELAARDERVILIEDRRELQCNAQGVVALRTGPGNINMAGLVHSALRLRPDRIIVGEVRGAEALDMLKAWNTGQPGGIATMHANSARGTLRRLEQLIQEAVVNVPRLLIAESIDVIACIAGRGHARRVTCIAAVNGLTRGGDYALEILPIDPINEEEPS